MLKKRVAVFACAVVFAIFAAGCATLESGRNFDATKAQTFQKGKTTRADIIAAMGAPSSTGSNSDGSFIEYQYQKDKVGGLSNYLAAYGIGSIKSDDTIKLCRFMFDANDKLKDYTCSKGAPNYSNFGK